MPKFYIVTLHVDVHDEKALRQAAREQLAEEGVNNSAACSCLDPAKTTVADCLRMMMDPGIPVPGTQIEDSEVEEVLPFY